MAHEYTYLIDAAQKLVNPIDFGEPDLGAGSVGCALRSAKGRIYTGICIDLHCGMGFCAEAAAIAEMLKGGETRIEAIVAAGKRGILSPCGRCREMMAQVNAANLDALVIVAEDDARPLRELLPLFWMEWKTRPR